MKQIIDFGQLNIDLDPLIQRVKAIPLSEWKYRSDVESDKTCKLVQGMKQFNELIGLIDQVLKEVEKKLKPGYNNRVVFSCVPSGEQILPHTDDFGPDVRSASVHCHVPLITDEKSILGYTNPKLEQNLKVGHLYIIDESQEHYVTNFSPVDRVHLLLAHWPHDKDINSLINRN